MRKFWSGVARFLAVLFSLLFILAAVLAVWLVRIDRRLFLPATYKTALAGQQVYARLPRMLAEEIVTVTDYNPCQENPLLCEDLPPEFKDCALQALGRERFDLLSSAGLAPSSSEMALLRSCLDQFAPGLLNGSQDGDSGIPAYLGVLGVSDWETLIGSLLPSDQLRQSTEQVLDQTFAYLNGQQDTVSLSLVPIKNRLAGQAGLNVFLQILRAQPDCTPEQLAQMLESVSVESGELVLCRPPEDLLDRITPQLRTQLNEVVAQIPDEQVLLDPESGENSAEGGPLAGLRFVRLVMRLSPDLALGFLLLVSLLAVRSLKSWLRWWGIPFFVTGLVSIGLVLVFSATFEQVWVVLLAGRIPAYLSLGLVTMLHDLAKAVLGTLLRSIGAGSLVLGLVGLGMWIGSRFIREPVQEAIPPAPVESAPPA